MRPSSGARYDNAWLFSLLFIISESLPLYENCCSCLDSNSLMLLLPLPKMPDRAVPTPQAGSMPDGFSNIVLGPSDGGIHAQATRHESRYGRREGAACTMGVSCLDIVCTQFSKAFAIKIHIYRVSNTMASLHHDMTGTQGMNGLCCCTHIVQRLDPLSGQHFGLVQIGRDYLGQRQEHSSKRSNRCGLK